jgi:hypothetical protein
MVMSVGRGVATAALVQPAHSGSQMSGKSHNNEQRNNPMLA